MKYLLIEHNYAFKESRVVEEHRNKYECLSRIEEFARLFILARKGDNNIINFYDKYDKNRVYDYFIERWNGELNKLTVKIKYISGYNWFFFKNVIIEPLVSFSFVSVEDGDLNINKEIHKDSYSPPICLNFNKCVDELKCLIAMRNSDQYKNCKISELARISKQ